VIIKIYSSPCLPAKVLAMAWPSFGNRAGAAKKQKRQLDKKGFLKYL
jgi:hypothetical protein